MNPKRDAALETFIHVLMARKAVDPVVMDVQALTSIADFFIICSGRSNRQVTAIAENVIQDLKKQGLRPLSREGLKEGQWVLLDYGTVIIHIFHEPLREFYDLEGLWIEAPRVDLTSYADAESHVDEISAERRANRSSKK